MHDWYPRHWGSDAQVLICWDIMCKWVRFCDGSTLSRCGSLYWNRRRCVQEEECEEELDHWTLSCTKRFESWILIQHSVLFVCDDFALFSSPKETLQTFKLPPENSLNRNSSFCDLMSILLRKAYSLLQICHPHLNPRFQIHIGFYFYQGNRDCQTIQHHQTSHKKERKPSSTWLFTWERIVSQPNPTRDACSCLATGTPNQKKRTLHEGLAAMIITRSSLTILMIHIHTPSTPKTSPLSSPRRSSKLTMTNRSTRQS